MVTVELTKPRPAQTEITEKKRDSMKPLRCAACQTPITTSNDRIGVNGNHEHTFFNPHGIVFHIGCFAAAPGARTAGPRSMEFTWFKGYSWQLAACSGCKAHLGWAFGQSGVTLFYGLILVRLVESGGDSGAE